MDTGSEGSAEVSPSGADGRVARGERSREAALDALLGLLASGARPTMGEVAESAGVSERSLFRHFESREAMLAAAIDRTIDRVAPLLEPVPLEGSATRRLERFLAARARVYEAVTPIRRAAPAHVDVPAVRNRLELAEAFFRAQVEDAFSPELRRVPVADRRDLLVALDAVLSFDMWDRLRTVGGASATRTRRIMHRLALPLLQRGVEPGRATMGR